MRWLSLMFLALVWLTAACGESTTGNGASNSCSDNRTNGTETDIDCGGDECAGCPVGDACEMASDCASSNCIEQVCAPAPTCTDGQLNGNETSTDCGGPDCSGCPINSSCSVNSDCDNDNCVEGTCEAPTCSDGNINGTETDVDCGGGVCAPCADGLGCTQNGDCASSVCGMDGTCAEPACDDGFKNGDETSVDCGGVCPGCPLNALCNEDDDCESGFCGPNDRCQEATCNDALQNGTETDVDCGGADCSGCATGQTCVQDDDCVDRICDNSSCAAPSCSDGVTNGNESDVDCGGDCGGCLPGQFCTAGEDCQSGVCIVSEFECAEPSCSDLVLNQDETDVDCGGPTCEARCLTDQMCTMGSDCRDQICDTINNVCVPPTCEDGFENGLEVGVDCGLASPCPRCDAFEDAFETGRFRRYYSFTGDTPWTVSNANGRIEGGFSALAGSITSNQSTGMRLEVRTATAGVTPELSFRYRTNTRINSHILRFFVNGSQQSQWSGGTNGTYELELDFDRVYTLEWRYQKNSIIPVPNEAVWVDVISLENGEPVP